MTSPLAIEFTEIDLDAIAQASGRVVVFVPDTAKLDQTARRVNRLTRGALERFVQSKAFGDLKTGQSLDLSFPTGMEADAVQVIKLPRKPSSADARKAGVAMGKAKDSKELLVLAGNLTRADELALGLSLRAYEFSDHKTKEPRPEGAVCFMVSKPEETAQAAADNDALTDGVFFCRDLVSEPANVLNTVEFAARCEAMQELGLEVEVLEEEQLEKLGMRLLLAVGQGSRSPSKVVVMRWNGGGDEAPFALVGKGVCFDAGGISLKPAAGMEDMTMDMGGAGVVAGVMRSIALRKAKANVIGLIGLVENMPDGNATRPGDVVASMKGDTVEIINTDAEGRLVLADVLWYAQEEYKPAGIINLATLTGAIIIGLGHEKAGVFGNDDGFCTDFLAAAASEGEGAWRMPLDPAYDKMLKSQVADMKNVGGRAAGSITAAQFLQRFIKEGTPWMHLDIAGVASVKAETSYAPKGASGWGVLSLDRLIRNRFEG